MCKKQENVSQKTTHHHLSLPVTDTVCRERERWGGGGGGGGGIACRLPGYPPASQVFRRFGCKQFMFQLVGKKRPKSWLTRIAKFPPEVLNLNVPGTSTPVYLLTLSLLSAGDRYRFSLYNIPTVVWLGWTGYITLQSLQ